MKFICEKEKMLKAIISVIKAVPIRTTKPILEGILIQTNDNQIKLSCYDLEIGIESIVKDCTIEEEGEIVVNAITFSEIIKKLPDTDIKIEIDSNNLLKIECEGSLYKLATMSAEDFPEIPKINIENSIELQQKKLKDIIRKTIFAISSDENRPIFTGCLFEVKENKLNVVAVDGFRLAWRIEDLEGNTGNFSAVIPGRTLTEINKIIEDTEKNIKLGINRNQVLFEIEDCKIVSRLLDGEFLDYKKAIPEKRETRIRINKNQLTNSFERISLISSSNLQKEKKYPVKVSIDVGKIIISCTNQTGDAKEEIFCNTEGNVLEVGFNPKFFLDVCKNIDDDEIFIDFGSSISPSVIKSVKEDGKYKYMILPIRIVNN